MKRTIIAMIATALLAQVLPGMGAEEGLARALQRGLFEEEANQNLPAAIEAYGEVVRQFDQDRHLAATAVFRLGEVYRKLGRTNDAVAQYQRVLNEFSDQPTLVRLSQQNLVGLGIVAKAEKDLTQLADGTGDEAAEIARIREMIRNSPDLIDASIPPDGNIRLHLAAAQGKLAVVRFLLDHGADIGARNNRELTPLHEAVKAGHKAMAELLLERGANVSARGVHGQTPLHEAAARRFQALAELLVKAGADINARAASGGTPLHQAAEAGATEILKLLLDERADVNARTPYAHTPLHSAVAGGRVEAAEILLERGAEPNARTVANRPHPTIGPNATPLVIARFNPGLVRVLLEHGANPNVSLPEGRPLLVEAAREGNVAAVELLLKHGADVNAMGPEGLSALRMAVGNGHVEMVGLLLEAGANVDAGGPAGETPLLAAVELGVAAGQPGIAELLLEKNADVDAGKPSGNAPLHAAAYRGEVQVAQLLLRHGANVNAQIGESGRTPLHIAVERRNRELVEVLLKAGADSNIVDKRGVSALDQVQLAARLLPTGPVRRLPPPRSLPSPAAAAPPTASEAEITNLLKEHGAMEFPLRRQFITLKREGAPEFELRLFERGTNDLNRYTLLEAIGRAYKVDKTTLSFPDMERIRIHRLKDNSEEEVLEVNVRQILESEDCAADPWLQWGDIVEISEAVHPLNESWYGLQEATVNPLTNCLARTVRVVVSGKTNELSLVPERASTSNRKPPAVSAYMLHDLDNVFRLEPALRNSKLLLTTSDLTAIQVNRKDSLTGEARELRFDLTQPWDLGAQFWLRDGDLITVPEK